MTTTAASGSVMAQVETPAAEQPQSEFGKDPLTLELVATLLQGDVSGYDVLHEAHLRGLSFAVDASALRVLEDAGADEVFLNRISQYSALPEIIQWENDARTRFEAGDHRATISACNELIQRCPRYVQMLSRRGECHLELGDYAKAAGDLRQVCEFNPLDYDARFALAKALFRGGALGEASFQLTAIIDELPAPSDNVFRERGDVFLRQGRYLDAAHAYRRALETSPLRPINLASLAELLATTPLGEQRDARAAQELSTAALEILSAQEAVAVGEQTSVYRAHAAALAAAGEFEQAATLLQSAFPENHPPDIERLMTAYARGEPIDLPPVVSPPAPIEEALTTIYEGLVAVEGGLLPGEGDRQTLVEPFLIGRHEVTNWEWAVVMGETPPLAPDEPREFINLPDVERFLDRLNGRLGENVRLFRLPTEDEWALAAQAGRHGPWYFGDGALLPEHAWFATNAGDRVRPVGQLLPNALGLFDVYGNVAEWCVPGIHRQNEALDSGRPDEFAIHRGGSFANTVEFVRGDVAVKASPRERLRGVGFRLAADPAPQMTRRLERIRVEPEGLDRAIQELRVVLQSTVEPGIRKEQNVDLLGLHYVRGVSRLQQHRFAEAIEDFKAILLPAVDDDGGMRGLALSQLAWIHATCPDIDVRNAPEARDEADRALALTRRSKWYAFSVAASASAALNNFTRAAQREEQALARAPEGMKPVCQQRLAAFQQGVLPDSTQMLFTFELD